MRHLFVSIVSLLLVGSALAGCNTSQSGSRFPTPSDGSSRAYVGAQNLPSHGVAIEGYCPVAYQAVGKPLLGKPEHASDYKGATYYFVSAEAKRAFDANPEKYAPAYGGWCAFGMAVEDKFPIDPHRFKIVDGRLMLFLANEQVDALELWKGEDENALVERANAHWQKVRG